MRWSRVLAVLWLGWVACGAAYAGGDRIVKVLPHYLDVHGKHAVSPSLFERDAYQAMLKANPDKRGGMQFDVRWKSGVASRRERVLRLELVTPKHPESLPLVIEQALPPKRKSGWAKVPIGAATAKEAGEIVAWRLALVVDGATVASQQSFLW